MRILPGFKANANAKTKKKISDMIMVFQTAITKDSVCIDKYHNLFFAQLFLAYAKAKKGDVALSILSNENLATQIAVSSYIQEGLEWLTK